MSTNDVYKVTMVFTDTISGKEYTTGYYILPDSIAVPTTQVVEEVCVAWWDTTLNSSGLTDGMKGLYNTELSLTNVKFRQWNPLSPTETQYSADLPISGVVTTEDPLPPQSSLLISLRTGNIGRSYRGRMYLPPVAEALTAERVADATALAAAKQTAGLFKEWDARTTDHATPVVFSKKLVATVPDGTPITSVRCDAIIRSQRRRQVNAPDYSDSSV